VTYGGGSSAELKLAGDQSGGDWAVIEWRVSGGDEVKRRVGPIAVVDPLLDVKR
jgi:hypothetical protein